MSSKNDDAITGSNMRYREVCFLWRLGITTYSQLASMRESEVRDLPRCGSSTFDAIERAMGRRGLSFQPEDEMGEAGGQPVVNVLKIKAAVRLRDSHQCRKCGMTSDEHRAKHGTDLHVHRLIPGGTYIEENCVTLCAACHGPMPRHAGDLIFKPASETGILSILFNLFDPDGELIHRALQRQADELGVRLDVLVERIILDWVKSTAADVGSYCI